MAPMIPKPPKAGGIGSLILNEFERQMFLLKERKNRAQLQSGTSTMSSKARSILRPKFQYRETLDLQLPRKRKPNPRYEYFSNPFSDASEQSEDEEQHALQNKEDTLDPATENRKETSGQDQRRKRKSKYEYSSNYSDELSEDELSEDEESEDEKRTSQINKLKQMRDSLNESTKSKKETFYPMRKRKRKAYSNYYNSSNNSDESSEDEKPKSKKKERKISQNTSKTTTVWLYEETFDQEHHSKGKANAKYDCSSNYLDEPPENEKPTLKKKLMKRSQNISKATTACRYEETFAQQHQSKGKANAKYDCSSNHLDEPSENEKPTLKKEPMKRSQNTSKAATACRYEETFAQDQLSKMKENPKHEDFTNRLGEDLKDEAPRLHIEMMKPNTDTFDVQIENQTETVHYQGSRRKRKANTKYDYFSNRLSEEPENEEQTDYEPNSEDGGDSDYEPCTKRERRQIKSLNRNSGDEIIMVDTPEDNLPTAINESLKFPCQFCDERFKSNSELLIHAIRTHQCAVCRRFYKVEILRQHIKCHKLD